MGKAQSCGAPDLCLAFFKTLLMSRMCLGKFLGLLATFPRILGVFTQELSEVARKIEDSDNLPAISNS